MALQERAAREGRPAPAIGIDAGDVLVDAGSVTGLAVDRARAVASRARPGEVVVTAVVRLLGSVGNAVAREPLLLDNAAVEVWELEWAGSSGGADTMPATPLPAGLAAATRQPLAGRDDQWQVLEDAWQRALSGGRSVVLIGGEAGAGKTRLAADFARACHAKGATVLLGSCDPELAVPYQPWVHALDHLLRSLPDCGCPPNTAADLGDLLVLLPHLERMVPGLRSPQRTDPETERYLMFSAVDRVLANACAAAPMVLLLDDVHWAGQQTLELLRHLVRSSVATQLLIVATFRDSPADFGEHLSACLADLQRSDCVIRLHVGALDVAGVEQYIAGALGHELDAPLRRVARVAAERSGGNAFFLGELWRHLLHHGVIVREGDRWVVHRDVAGVGSPDSVRDVVASRMARVSRPARRILELAAAAGQRAEQRVLSRASGEPDMAVATALDELVDAGFVVEVASRHLTYEFAHALVRDTVEEVVPAAARARLHLQVAEAMEQLHAGDLRPVYAELAHHFAHAARVGGTARAVHYGSLAAAQAKASGAYEEAISHLHGVLELLPPDELGAAETRIELAHVEMQRGNSSRAQTLYGEAFNVARAASATELSARAALGYEEAVHQPGAPGGPAVRMVTEAINALGDGDPALRTRLQASLTRSLFLSGAERAAIAAGDVALSMARELGDAECLVAALQATTIMCRSPYELLTSSTELRDTALTIGDHWSAVYATGNMCRALVALGRLDEAAAVLDMHRPLSDRGRFLVFQFMGHVFEAVLALAAGRFADAEAAAERAHALGESSRSVFDAGVYGLQMFAIRREQGRLAEVLPVVRMLTAEDEPSVWRPGLAVLLAEVGMLAEAHRELEEMSPERFAAIPRDSVWPGCLTFLAETCIACDAVAHAATLLAELDVYAGQTLMVAMTACFGPADRLRGGLCRVLGRHDEARRHFAAALQLCDRSGSPAWRARVLLDAARLEAAEGKRARATALATEALQIAVELGMAAVAEHGQRLIDELGNEGPSSTPAVPGGLSGRELEVLRLIAAGCSNREIGDRLFISQHTAANHVRAILQKCGSANRAEAAAYAARHGLLEPA